MKLIRRNSHWMFALFGGICLTAAAVSIAQRHPSVEVPSARDASALSTVFRTVAHEALPSIVSIETLGKAVRQTGQSSPFGDENSPLHDLFKNDPRFKEYFDRIPRSRGMGSGFVIDASGVIMTNSHVVRDAQEVKVRLHDGREFIATDIKADPRSDVAIIRIESPTGLRALPLGDSDAIQIGDWVLAVGSPFGLDMSVTAGIISGKGRGPRIAERENFLQTDAAINPGNSGGPLLNLNGEVIGINTAISTRSGGYDGVGFAIPSNMAGWVSGQLVSKGAVKRAFLGVSVQPMNSSLSKQFNTRVGDGAIVTDVIPDSPAAAGKLDQGDVILQFAGQKVTGPRNLQGIVEKLNVDQSYEMVVLRDGKRLNLDVTVREMPSDYSLTQLPASIRRPSSPGTMGFQELGIEIKELTPQLAEQLDLKAIDGVLISSVKTDSPADLAGLRVGQVIQKIGTKKVKTSSDVREAMKSASLKDGILLLVRSRVGTQFVSIRSNK